MRLFQYVAEIIALRLGTVQNALKRTENNSNSPKIFPIIF